MKISNQIFLCSVLMILFLLAINHPVLSDVIVSNRPPQLGVVPSEVDPQSGAAMQVVPIVVPEGLNHIQPDIVLVYHSSRPLNALGVGWSLELGAIERSPKRGVPKYDDTDQFILIQTSGQQNLVYDPASLTYHTQIEGAFSKIEKLSNSWVVTDRQGTKYFFGATIDSRQVDPGNASRMFRWALNRIEDIHGNYLTISYLSFDNQLYPQFIRYTANDTVTPALTSFAEVEFQLENRLKSHRTYAPGFLIETKKRFSKIIVRAAGQLQREYRLGYTASQATQRDLLTSVTQVGSDGATSLPPILFQYYETDKGFQVASGASIPTAMRFSNQAGGINPPMPYQDLGVRIADLNGDAYPDMIRDYVAANGTRTKAIYLNSKNLSWTLDTTYAFPGDCSTSANCMTFIKEVSTQFNGTIYPDNALSIADINGDGTNDLLYSQLFYNITGTNIQTGFNKKTYSFTNNAWQDITPNSWGTPNDSQFMIWLTWNNNSLLSYRIELLGNLLADVNGDGFVDIVTSKKGKQTASFSDATQPFKSVFLNRLKDHFNGWINEPLFTRPDNDFTDFSKGATLVDLNGDGLPDIFYRVAGTTKVFMNTGTNWQDDLVSPWLNTLSLGDTKDGSTVFDDINGDGLADMVIAKGNFSSGSRVLINTGSGWVQDDAWVLTEGSFINLGTRLLDADANAMLDVIVHYNGVAPKLYLNQGKPADLLKSVNNSVGGVSSFQYGSSAQFLQTFMPFAMPVLTSLTKSNGLGDSYTTRFEYTQGVWSPTKQEPFGSVWINVDREFRGFGKVKVIEHEGPYTEMDYLQGTFNKGRMKEQRFYEASGTLLRKETNIWDVQAIITGVNFVFLKQKTVNFYGSGGQSLLKKTEFTYAENPQYGNPTKIIDTGELKLVNGNWVNDVRTVDLVYNQNTTSGNWLLGLPKTITVKDTGNNLMRQSWFYYDGNHTNIDAIPTQGHLTKEENWAGTASSADNPKIYFEYTSYGLVSAVTDPLGKRTTIVYDSNYKLFLLTVANPLNQTMKKGFYGVNGIPLNDGNGFSGLWGQVKFEEDENAQQVKQVYDVLGRAVKTIGPLDSLSLPTTTISYALNPTYTKITTQRRINNGQSPTFDSYTFTDGLGRLLQTKSPSATPGQYIVGGQSRTNSRNTPLEEYLPFFSTNSVDTIELINSAQAHVGYVYDGLGRVTRLNQVDGRSRSLTYDVLTVQAIDENGHREDSTFDSYGQLLKKVEYTGSDGRWIDYPASSFQAYATTNFTYDSEGNLIGTLDPAGNLTTIQYDKLGRKIGMTDPDMGGWSYGYDLNSNLTRQTDSQGQQIIFSYDDLNRLTRKTDLANLSVDYVYEDAAVPNSIGRLTKASTTGADRNEYRYDLLGRSTNVLQTIGATTYSTQPVYDALDRATRLIYPDNSFLNYTYNLAGQLEKLNVDFTQSSGPMLPAIPSIPSLNNPTAQDKAVGLSWGSVSGSDGYWIRYGTSSGNLNNVVDVGNTTTATMTGLTNGTLYYFAAAAYNAGGVSANSTVKSATPQAQTLNAPAVSQTTAGSSSVSLTWGSVSGATRYLIKYGTATGNYPNVIDNITATTFDVVGLNPGTTYYFVVLAASAANTSSPSTEVSKTTLNPPTPDTPILQSATAGNGLVTLQWGAISNATGYKVKYGTTSGSYPTVQTVGNVTSFQVTGLTNNTAYYFVVSATNAAGESNNSNEKSATPSGSVLLVPHSPIMGTTMNNPDVIASHRCLGRGAKQSIQNDFCRSFPSLSMNDQDSSLYQENFFLTAQKVFLQTARTVGDFFFGSDAYAQTTGLDLTTYTENDPLNIITMTPSCATFTNVESFTSTAYVYKALSTQGDFTYDFDFTVGNTSSSSFTDVVLWGVTNKQPAATYNSWTDGFYAGVNSSIFGPKLILKVIGGASTTSNVLTQGTRYYPRVTRTGTTLKVQIYLNAQRTTSLQTLTLNNVGSAGFNYVYAFSAKGSGTTTNQKITGDLCNVATTEVVALPGIPVLNSASAGQGSVFLQWSAAANAASYTVKYGTSSLNYTQTIANITGTSTIISTLTNGTTYYFAVQAVNAAGASGLSNEKFATPQWQMPAAPQISQADAGSGQVTLGWNSVTNATGYKIKYGTTAGTYTTINDVGNVTQSVVNGLNYNTKYYFVVVAYNPGGDGALSSEVARTTLGVAVPNQPALNNPTPKSQQVSLSWPAVSGANGYKIKYGRTPGNYSATITVQNVTGYAVGNLTNGTTYYFALVAYNAGGDSIPSVEKSATPQAVTLPGVPTLNTPQGSNQKVVLSWSAIGNADGYKVKYGTTAGSYPNVIDVGNVTQYAINHLTNGTAYYVVVTAYNAAGESGSSSQGSAIPTLLTTCDVVKKITYNAAGQKTRVEYGSGVITDYQYDVNLRLSRITTTQPNSVAAQDVEYTYDGIGNITRVRDYVSGVDETFQYDELSRLAQAGGNYGTSGTFATLNYQYNPIGNLTNNNGAAYTYPTSGIRPHAVSSTADENFVYDNNGNMKQKTQGATTTDYVYDSENRLTQVKQGANILALYAYDDEGQRTKKTTGGATTNFVGDVYEGRSTGRTTHIYLDDGTRVASVANRDVSYFHGDHLGSARLVADDLGNMIGTTTYKPFGEFAKQTGFVGQEGRFFTDQYRDNESGLYYYNARYYNPKIAHFLTADTMIPSPDNSQSFNRYAYVQNNPVNLIDPSGHVAEFMPLYDDNFNVSNIAVESIAAGNDTSYYFSITQINIVNFTGLSYSGTMDSLKGIAFNEADIEQAALWGDPLTWNPKGEEITPREPDTFDLFLVGFPAEAAIATLAKSAFKFSLTRLPIGATGKIGEKALESLGGKAHQYFPTSNGRRFVDRLVGRVAHEAKVGYQALTKALKAQISKDVELLQQGTDIDEVIWHFFKSPVTDQGGPSKPLLEELTKSGIKVIIEETP